MTFVVEENVLLYLADKRHTPVITSWVFPEMRRNILIASSREAGLSSTLPLHHTIVSAVRTISFLFQEGIPALFSNIQSYLLTSNPEG